MRSLAVLGATIVLLGQGAPASAGEIFGGVYKHDVDTPLTLGDHPDDGVDFQLRFDALHLEERVHPSCDGSGH